MKKRLTGVVHNVSTNPFQTFSSRRVSNSKLLTFDISFDLCDEDGRFTHVWLQRSFRFPPPLEDGDVLEIEGRQGHFMGLVGRANFYASRVIDKKRQKEYTPWRNKDFKAPEPGKGEAGQPAG